MTRYLLALLWILPFTGFAQSNSDIRNKSRQTFVYHITAAQAEQFYKWDSIPVSQFVNAIPVDSFTDIINEDVLPIGSYVLLTVRENNIEAEIINRSNLIAFSINNKRQFQIDVKNKAGEFIEDAKIFVNNKEAIYHTDAKTYWTSLRKLEEALVKICTPGDTLFFHLTEKDNEERPISLQRKRNYKNSKIYKYLNWTPKKIKQLLHLSKYKNKGIGANGYIIFNQPKYKPLDTLKFKGYIINKKWKQYKKDIDVFINYYDKGEEKNQFIKKISTVSPGAYTGEFVIADTMPMDKSYTLSFRNHKGKQIFKETFKTEDYLLDEIGSYNFKMDKDIYFRNDSLRFFASAKDANGLSVMGAKVNLTLTVTTINKIYTDTLFVADTVYSNEIKLLTNGETKFVIPANSLPKADMKITATLIFKNSNNELHDESKSFDYKYLSKEIIATQDQDSMKAVYIENGIETPINGEMEMNEDTALPIKFPYSFKIDPVASGYTFYVLKKAPDNSIVKSIDVEDGYRLNLNA